MGLGIVSNQDFESELSNSSSLNRNINRTPEIDMSPDETDNGITNSATLIKKYHEHGRNEGDINVPQSLRKLIGDTATFEGRPAGLQLASSLGISNSSVSSYTNPNNSALSESNKSDIDSFLTERKVKISKRAINKLGLAISMIDEDKLKKCSARELSGVAKDMSQVVKHMEPSIDSTSVATPVQFFMYAPEIKTENKYQTVIAKDNY
jgi:hypothetical protein